MREILERVEEHKFEACASLAADGIEVGRDFVIEAITLQGSQNYGTHHAASDVDTKMVVTPTYRALLEGTKFNQTVILDNGEHCDVRTGMDIIHNICKGNINWIEGMYTEYAVYDGGTWWADMVGLRDSIVVAVRKKILSAAYGMALQKVAHLYKPTATTKPYFDEHGFDNKNFIHIVRLCQFEQTFAENMDFGPALDFASSHADFMQQVRDGKFMASEVEKACKDILVNMDHLYKKKNEEWGDVDIDATRKQLEARYVEWILN